MIVNLDYIKSYITTDDGPAVPYRWTHGANDLHLGDGLVIYALIQQIRAGVCVCLGSGGGFIPRIMTQARFDLFNEGIIKEEWNEGWDPRGATYVVDACNEVGGHNSWADEGSFFRTNFYPRFIKDTTENAFYNFFVKQGIKIDFLHIDADHSFEGVKKDFELYSTLMNPGGIISLHDTDESYEDHLIVSEDNKPYWFKFDGPAKFVKSLNTSWEKINLFNEGKLQSAPATTGLTIVQKKMPKVHLVTVVADFHFSLTLVQELKHYKTLVDDTYVVFYTTDSATEKESFAKFASTLLEHGVYPDYLIHKRGKKYDWDQVTAFYNEVVSNYLNNPEDWWIISDADELQYWPENDPKKFIKDADEKHCTFITGGFLDRIGQGGTFPKIEGPEDNLDKLFPLVGFFRYPMSGACPNKVVAVKSGQTVCSGQHYATFPDGTNSWGKFHPLRYPVDKCFVQTHHFKWDSTVLDRLVETAESGCSYSEEYQKMREAIVDDRIDIENPKFYIEEYVPGKGYASYSEKWPRIREKIIKI